MIRNILVNMSGVKLMHWKVSLSKLFYDGGTYHKETSPLICSANKWTGFYMIGISIMKELKSEL